MKPGPNGEARGETMLRTGIVGAIVAAVCCFTPLLVVVAAGVGLSAVIGWLDYVLFPVLFGFLGVIAYALYLRAGRPGASPKAIILALVVALSALIIGLGFRYAVPLTVAAVAAVAVYGLSLRALARRRASPIE